MSKTEYQYKFSVIIATYNTSWERLKLSIDSVITQEFDSFELIISDDCSVIDHKETISKYLNEKGFVNWRFRKSSENLGTVKSYYRALKMAFGKYIKGLGQGDCLYDNLSLAKMYSFLEKNGYNLAFGKMETYHISNGKCINMGEFKAPKNINLYRTKYWRIYSRLNILVFHDGISGVSMFGKRKVLLHYIGMLQGISKYAEDFFEFLVFAERQQFYFFDEYIVYYEYGLGTSTGKDTRFKRQLREDSANTIEFAKHRYHNKLIYKLLLTFGSTNNEMVKYVRAKLKKRFENLFVSKNNK